ncbi:MAG TPA: 50S ribosomal protein L3 [Nitrospiria bacterium]|jgi:large subunit ribosomal protein L3|nr:50S ribosomal protein L3 [Nitrospiria bacterium]
MINGMLGEKIGMTQIYDAQGKSIQVTVVEAGPCRVIQKKTVQLDGYEAVQLAFREISEKKVSKALLGHFKKSQAPPARFCREFKADLSKVELGQMITADIFKVGDWVDVSGISKGKGFAGVMKRHHFKGGPATHGSMFHREPGSIGSSSWPSRVRKNKRLPGRMGSERVTTLRLEVVEVREKENLIFIRGALPGSAGALLEIRRSNRV